MATPLTPSVADALQEAKSAAQKEGNEPVAPGKKCCPLPGLPVYAHDLEPPKEDDKRDFFLGFARGFPILYPDIFWADVWKARHLWKPVADVRLKGPWKGEKGNEDTIVYTTSARGFALLHSPVSKEKKEVAISIGAPRVKKLRPKLDTKEGSTPESAFVSVGEDDTKKDDAKKEEAKKDDAKERAQDTIEVVPPEGRREPMVFLRKVCLSVPGKEAAEHKTLDLREENQLTLDFPELAPETGDVVRLLCVAPHWKFRFTKGGTSTDLEGDPWTKTPAGLSEKLEWTLEEIRAVPRTSLGRIEDYTYKTKSGQVVTLYGSGTGISGSTRTDELADRYEASLGPSRALVVKAIKNVEGGCESTICYDGPKASWGINQWNKAELWGILAYIADFYPEAFERGFGRWGIRLHFKKRGKTWEKGDTYAGVVLYRVPCCGAATRTMMDAKTNAERAALSGELIPLTYKDSASYAFLWMLVTAGRDPEIQKAQTEWTSFRITWALKHLVKDESPSVLTVMDAFLKSLGSNESADARRKKAAAVIGNKVDLPFDDREAAPKDAAKKAPAEAGKEPPKERKLLGDPAWIFWEEKCKEKKDEEQEQAPAPKKSPGKKGAGNKGGSGAAGKK